MRAPLFLIPLLLSSGACKESPDQSAAAAKATAPTATASASASVTANRAKGVAVAVAEKSDLYEFEYSYPAEAGGPAVLRDYLDKDLASAKNGLEKDAAAWRKEAEVQGFPYHPYSSSTEWEVVSDLPGWLSLSAQIYVFSGGAHGNSAYDSLVFDRRANVIRRPLDLFRTPDAFWQAVEKRWCAGLDKEREKRRGGPLDKSDDLFGACPNLDELTLLLGSSNGQTFDRLTLIAPPYIAGPYVEGAYEVNVDFDAALVAAAKPEFAKDFTVHR